MRVTIMMISVIINKTPISTNNGHRKCPQRRKQLFSTIAK